jgi:hypothetical protein
MNGTDLKVMRIRAHLIVADLEPEALQATSQIVSLSERRLRQTDPDGGQAA